MIRKFDCKNCNKQFEANEKDVVFCPHCHSDNVEPARSHLPSWIRRMGWTAIFTLAVGISICWLYNRINDNSELSKPGVSINPNDTTDYPIDVPPPTVEVTGPEFDGKNYAVDVRAVNVPKGLKFYYVRMNHFGDKKVLQKSDDGLFSDIPFCEEDGHSYDFAIMDVKTDTLLCVPVVKTGFIKQVFVAKKMSKEELQQLIVKRDPSLNGVGENDYLAPDYVLKFSNLPVDAVNVPNILAEVTDKLEMEVWENVTVVDLGYDDMNRINSITLKVVMAGF